MLDEEFIQKIEYLRNNLVNMEVNRAFNSIGTNIFIKFGKDLKIIRTNGREWIAKEWSIWLSNTSWRITKDGKYVVGAEDLPEIIQEKMQCLLGQRFLSLEFISSFLDLSIHFDNGYKITTFFYWMEEGQWLIFYPDRTNIKVNCHDSESIQEVQRLSANIQIVEEFYEKWDLSPLKNCTVQEIIYDEEYPPMIKFDHFLLLDLEMYNWRLEKENGYITGNLDEYLKKEGKLSQIIGKKISQIDIANNNMDYRILFDDGYCLKMFSCRIESGERMGTKVPVGLVRIRQREKTES